MKLYYSNHLTNNIRDRNTSHLLLEKMLYEYYHILPEQIVRRSGGGKPFLEGPGTPCFSVSHTGSLWLCAVTDHETGIDAERLNRSVTRPLKLAERYLSKEESRFIAAGQADDLSVFSGEPDIIERFRWERILPGKNTDAWTVSERLLLIWTRKEALLKYTGEGLGRLSGSRSVMEEPEGLSVRSYRNGTIILSVCAEEKYCREAVTEYIDLDSGKVHKKKNVRLFRR